eukprot:1318893-Pyramimonas_sp.AAC.1
MLRPSEKGLTLQSSGPHVLRRSGFTLPHASYLNSTLSQGQTLRKGVTIDCARAEDADRKGMSDERWWVHLCVILPCHVNAEPEDREAAHARVLESRAADVLPEGAQGV